MNTIMMEHFNSTLFHKTHKSHVERKLQYYYIIIFSERTSKFYIKKEEDW